jgi:hypothetical protein
MVMCARTTPEGHFLFGTEDAFDSLLSDLYDEVGYEMQSRANLQHLSRLIEKLEPAPEF